MVGTTRVSFVIAIGLTEVSVPGIDFLDLDGLWHGLWHGPSGGRGRAGAEGFMPGSLRPLQGGFRVRSADSFVPRQLFLAVGLSLELTDLGVALVVVLSGTLREGVWIILEARTEPIAKGPAVLWVIDVVPFTREDMVQEVVGNLDGFFALSDPFLLFLRRCLAERLFFLGAGLSPSSAVWSMRVAVWVVAAAP